MKHPAKYSDSLLPFFKELLQGRERVLDPFAGTGKLKEICPNAVLIEIEPEWANMNKAIVMDMRDMPISWSETFDAICTSPTYGNRLADHHNARDGSQRFSYRHVLGRPLNDRNSGKMQWGSKYRIFHQEAWKECFRVLKFGGIFILNISDHIRAGERVHVVDWHIETIKNIGFVLKKRIEVKTPRLRNGKNYKLRVDSESVLLFEKVSE